MIPAANPGSKPASPSPVTRSRVPAPFGSSSWRTRERHRAVERAQREKPRPLFVLDLERRVQLASEHMTRLVDMRPLPPGGMDPGLPARQIRDVDEVVEHVFGRPGDLDCHLCLHSSRIRRYALHVSRACSP